MNIFEHLLVEGKTFKFSKEDFNSINDLYRGSVDDDRIIAWIETNMKIKAPWTADLVFKEFVRQK